VKLTKEQAKMVIEFFSQQAAEDLPVRDSNWKAWDRHMWMTCYTVSLAIERKINEHDWATLLNAALDWQSFDRDPAGYLYERGEDDNEHTNNYYHEVLQDVLSASIDTAFNTSKAA
jgi:hypothetical protein